jgi:hypothetical protein
LLKKRPKKCKKLWIMASPPPKKRWQSTWLSHSEIS